MKTNSHSKSYGLKLVGAQHYFDCSNVENADLTLMAAQGLAMAYQAVLALGGDPVYIEKCLSRLESAWRIVLYLRSKQPVDSLDETGFTRFGRFRGTSSVSIVERPTDGEEENLDVGGVNRPVYRPKVRKRRRKIRG